MNDLTRPTLLPERKLDLLRAVAVLSVVADHTLRLSTRTLGPVSANELGSFGVYIFFVHTALVLMSSLERSRAVGARVRDFYVRRAFRIYPLAWATIALVLLTRAPVFVDSLANITPYRSPTVRELVANAALMQNILGTRDLLAPLWSLPVEVQMYLVLPIAFLLAWKHPRTLGIVAVVGLGASLVEWRVRLTTWDVPLLWRLTVLSYVPCFLCGVIAYAVLRRRTLAVVPAWTLAIAIPAAFAVLVCAREFLGTPWAWLGCVGVLAIILGVRDSPDVPLTRFAKTVATYSYGVYLLHSFAIAWAFVTLRSAPAPVQWTVFVVLLVALPFAAYHMIERPGIALGKWAVQQRARATASDASLTGSVAVTPP